MTWVEAIVEVPEGVIYPPVTRSIPGVPKFLRTKVPTPNELVETLEVAPPSGPEETSKDKEAPDTGKVDTTPVDELVVVSSRVPVIVTVPPGLAVV